MQFSIIVKENNNSLKKGYVLNVNMYKLHLFYLN